MPAQMLSGSYQEFSVRGPGLRDWPVEAALLLLLLLLKEPVLSGDWWPTTIRSQDNSDRGDSGLKVVTRMPPHCVRSSFTALGNRSLNGHAAPRPVTVLGSCLIVAGNKSSKGREHGTTNRHDRLAVPREPFTPFSNPYEDPFPDVYAGESFSAFDRHSRDLQAFKAEEKNKVKRRDKQRSQQPEASPPLAHEPGGEQTPAESLLADVKLWNAARNDRLHRADRSHKSVEIDEY